MSSFTFPIVYVSWDCSSFLHKRLRFSNTFMLQIKVFTVIIDLAVSWIDSWLINTLTKISRAKLIIS